MTNADNATSAKVKVSKEVAEAIEDVRSVGYTDFQIIQDTVEDEGKTAYGTKMPALIKFAKYSSENQQTLFLALANEYEVEKTPEEMVAEQYRNRQRMYDKFGNDEDYGAMEGIEFVAKAYGLKNEGVSD